MLDKNTLLATLAYAVITGLFNLLLGHKSQVEAWAESNPGLAAVLKFTRAIGLDPWGIIAALSLTFQKKLPEAQKADSVIALREEVKAEQKAEEKARKKGPPDDGGGPVSLMPEPVRLVAQDRSRLHNDRPDPLHDEPAEFRSWHRPAWFLAFALPLMLLLGCISRVDWPKVVGACAEPLAQAELSAVQRILAGNGDTTAELENLAKAYAPSTIECAVQQIVGALSSRMGAARDDHSLSRGRAFLAKVQK